MKLNFKRFLRDESGNNLVISLIILGIIALPLIFWLTGLANSTRDRSAKEADQIFNEDAGSQYKAPGGMASLELDPVMRAKLVHVVKSI